MEIWLTHKGERLRLPITPFFNVERSQNNSTELVNEVGTINIKGKKGLRHVSLDSFFPSKEYDFLESSDVNLNPYFYDEKLEKWANADEPLRLIITETPYNFEVLIDSYSSGEQDGTGDVYYSLSLSEYVRVSETQYEKPTSKKIKKEDVKRFVGTASIPLALLTVGKYDTAWTMAKKLTGNGENAKKLLEQSGIKKLVKGSVMKL